MKLHQIKTIRRKVLKAPFHKGCQILLVVALGHMRIEATSGLGCDERTFATAFLHDIGDDFFRPAVTVNVGGINEGRAVIKGGMQGRARVSL